MKHRVYISCHDKSLANQAAVKLIEAGHRIVSTWHEPMEEQPAAGDAERWAEKANQNFEEIRDCDLFVLIASQEHLSGGKRLDGGKFIEAGFAVRGKGYGHGNRIFTVGGVENGMLWHGHFEKAATVEELIRVLEESK